MIIMMYNQNIILFIFGGRRISSGNIEKLSSLGGDAQCTKRGGGEYYTIFNTLSSFWTLEKEFSKKKHMYVH